MTDIADSPLLDLLTEAGGVTSSYHGRTLVRHFGDAAAEYAAATESAAVFDRSHRVRLRVHGKAPGQMLMIDGLNLASSRRLGQLKRRDPDAAPHFDEAIACCRLEVSGGFQFLCRRADMPLANFIEFYTGADTNVLVGEPGEVDRDSHFLRRMKVLIKIPIQPSSGRTQIPSKPVVNPLQIAGIKALKQHRSPTEHGALLNERRIRTDRATVEKLERVENPERALVPPLLVPIVAPQILVAQSDADQSVHAFRQACVGPV